VKSLTSLLTIALASSLAAPLAAESWDMPMAYPDNNFHTETGKEFAACVAEGSGGALELVIHGNGSLFAGNDIKRAVQTGQAPIGERLLSAHQNENPIFGVDSVPFMATGYDASVQLWEIAKPTLETILDEQNLVLLYSVPWPPQGIYAKKELTSAADMEGVKFRSYNNATARMAELMGAVPVQIEAAELSQALATGVAESFISSGSTGVDEKVWEHLTHWYEADAWLPRNHVFVNKDSWSTLDEATQAVVRDCAAAAEETGTANSRALADVLKQTLADNGMTVQPPGEPFAADLLSIGETMTGEWLEAAGDDGKAIVDAFKAN